MAMTTTMNVVLTDVGEEIDDEVMFHFATETSKGSTWFFVCVPGASSTDPGDATDEVNRRLARFKALFPLLEPAPDQTHYRWTSPLNSTFYVGPPSMLRTSGLVVDNLIRIAPLWHIEPAYFNRFGWIKNYIVMGDLANPDQSLNLTKAMPKGDARLRAEYCAQESTIQTMSERVLSIPTKLARNVALPYALVDALPDCLREPLLDTAFAQCVGRVSANVCYANGISVINHKTILNYLEPGQIDDVPDEVRVTIANQVEQFLEQASKADRSDTSYRTRLEEIAAAIYVLTGGIAYRDGSTFHKDNLFEPEEAKAAWLAHIETHGCDLTPCYDLLALVVKEKGYVPDVEECRTAVKAFSV